ncbi:MAG: TRAP transporter small permease, partial [Gammaproteobacteria bacterium]|nr:TRAP transporter small permease [Gammaproteobacteria bacterium]
MLFKPVLKALRRIEDGVLALILAAMIALAAYQVIARNLFDTGLLWGDALVRV